MSKLVRIGACRRLAAIRMLPTPELCQQGSSLPATCSLHSLCGLATPLMLPILLNPFEHKLDSWFSPILVTPMPVWVAAPTPHVSAVAPLPWYTDPCVHSAMWNGILKIGVDSIGLLPATGGLARMIGHQAGYIGFVADNTGHAAIDAVQTSARTVEGLNGITDTSATGSFRTVLAGAGFVPALNDVAAGLSIGLDAIELIGAARQCR